MVKNLPVKRETQETPVRSLSQEDPMEEGIAIHSSILAQRISWTEELSHGQVGYSPYGRKELHRTEVTKPACI